MIEDCPSCGSKLEKGFISGAKITWIKKKNKFFPVPLGWRYKTQCYSAYRCIKCNLVLFFNEPLTYHYRLLGPSVDLSYIKREKIDSHSS